MFGFPQKIFGVTLPGFNRRPRLPQQVGSNGRSHNKGPVGAKSNELATKSEPRELGELVALMDEDYQIQFARYILAANIASVQVNVTVENGDGDRSESIQKSLQTLWENSVSAMQDSIGYGRVAFEKTWRFDESSASHVVEKLDALPFDETRMILADADKSFDGVSMKTEDGTWVKICRQNSWWLALFPTAKQPHGRSQYLGAVFKSWKRKNSNIDNRQMLLQKFLIPGGKGHIPMTDVDETTGVVTSVPDKIAAALGCRKSGGYLMMPHTQHPTMEGKYAYDIEDATQILDPAPIDAVLTNDDVAILRAFGIPEKTVTEGGSTGSFAMVTQQMLTLFARVESLLSEFVKSFQQYVVDKIREMNYGDSTVAGPMFVVAFTKITNRPDSLVGELLKILVANPQFATVIVSGGVDMRELLTKLGLPVSDEFEALIQQVAARFAAASGAVPGAGAGGAGFGMDNADGSAGGGEYSGMARRGWQNNRKAIEDVRRELKDGTMQEPTARVLLATLKLPAAAIDALIADVLDGGADEPLDKLADENDPSVKKK